MKKKNARVATQFGRAAQDAKQQQSKNKNKSKKSHKSALERPWPTLQFEELTKEERDIVLDRIQKEIVDVIAASSSNSTKGADTTTIAPVRHAFQSFIARGVNEVARLVAKRELRVVVFANNPESLAFAHIPLLCRLHSVPICVLHLSSKTFGKMFGLNSLVVLGVKRLPRAVSSDKTEDVAVDASAEATEESAESIEMPPAAAATGLSDLERSRLKSITEFLISKASKKSRTLHNSSQEASLSDNKMAAASLRKVLVVVGTTGAGKTKLSIDLAKAVGGEIINSDAMQMYRGLDIATAKITEQEKEGVPHHLFDIVDPSSRCDVLAFKKLALRTIEDVLARGKVPIIVGGTMYYTQSILWKSQLLDDVDIDAAAVSIPASGAGNNGSEAQEVDHRTPEQLFAKLREVDPVMASRLHVNNVRKVQRSLQVFQQTGIPHSEHIARQEKENLNLEKYFDACAFWVHCNKQTLAARLAKRVDTMISSGLVEEIKTLRAHVKANPPRLNPSVGANDEDNEPENSVGILQAIGYKEFQPYFDALEAQQAASPTGTELPDDATESATDLKRIFDECVEQLNIATRQYARRQLSWIRNRFVTRNIPVYQVDSSDVSQWDALVGGPAVHIAQAFLANGVISDSYKSIQEAQPEAAKELSLAEKYAENICEICGGRKFTGVKQWASHLASKGHKFHLKRVEIEKNGGGKVQYLRSKQTRAMQSEADNKSEEGEPNCDEAALKRAKVSDDSADGEPSSTTSPV